MKNIKQSVYSLIAALLFGFGVFTISGLVTAPSQAAIVSDGTEVQVLDTLGNELTDPLARPTTSGGFAAIVGIPQKSGYRIKLINPYASCGTSYRYRGYVHSVAGSNAQTTKNLNAPLTGIASTAAGWYLYTDLANDNSKTLDFTFGFFRE